jgi:hypothetical protein
MALCLSEKAYLAAAKHCGVTNPDRWLETSRQTACVHTWEDGAKLMCIVCLKVPAGYDAIDVACTLVHESVHVFQRLCDSIGESSPSREFEAYSIERIAERLMREYVRQTAA